MLTKRTLASYLLLLSTSWLAYAAPIDSGLFTTYSTDNAKTTLYWVVCGSIPPGYGCYGTGELGHFGRIGSVIEGKKVYNNTKGTITRYFYLIDQASGSSQNEVVLYAYKRIDSIVNAYDTTTFSLVKTVALPLTGGTSAEVFIGANKGFLVIGTSLSHVPVAVAKNNYAITPLTIISAIPTSITADNYGFVTVTSASADEFFVVGPDGAVKLDGGGSPVTVNTLLGTAP